MNQSILLVKLGPIGDVVMASPILAAAERLLPGSRITWLTTASLRPLIERMSPRPEIITVDDQALWHGSVRQRAGVFLGLRRRLGSRAFDLGLFGHANRRLRMLLWGTRVGMWRSFDLDAVRPLPMLGRRHHDEHVRLLTGEDGPSPMRATFPRIERRSSPIVLPDGPCIALVPGGARNPLRDDPLRRWPVAHYAALARLLVAAGRKVVLCGGPDDAWVRPYFSGLEVLDAIGRTSIDGLLDLFAGCAAVVAHDSGPMHLADLAGARVIALFGPTSPQEKGPINDRARILWGGEALACRPCYDGIGYAACVANRCLMEVTPETVAASVLSASP
jgi:heptosyltransferase-2